MWCNNTLGSIPEPSKEEYEELVIQEFENSLDPSNIRYWKLKNKRKE